MNQAYEDLWSYHKDRIVELGFEDGQARSIIGMALKRCGHDATRTRCVLEWTWNGDPSRENFVRFLQQQINGAVR